MVPTEQLGAKTINDASQLLEELLKLLLASPLVLKER